MVDYLSWFQFCERNSQEFGIVITDYDVYSSPSRETNAIKIPGLNGDIIQSNNRYENVNVSYRCAIIPHTQWHDFEQQINEIKLWLNSSVDDYSELVDSFNTNVYRMAYFNGSIKPVKNGTVYEFDIEFSCEPFKYGIETEETVNVAESGLSLNLTNYDAYCGIPKIVIYQNASNIPYMQFVLNGTNWFVVSSKKTIIDSKIGKVYTESDGGFCFYHNGNSETFITPKGMPLLKNGENILKVSASGVSNISKIILLKRWCYL